jgi:ER membrane protein SH3
VSAFVTAGAGFLLAVLWFDLMFDVQVLGRPRGEAELPEPLLASISAYYRRVTTAARPMNRLVAAVMLGTLAALVVEVARGEGPAWAGWASLALALAAISIAAVRTVPGAVRLGTLGEGPAVQSRLARSICRDHVICFAAIAALLAIQLGFAT